MTTNILSPLFKEKLVLNFFTWILLNINFYVHPYTVYEYLLIYIGILLTISAIYTTII